MEIGIDFSASFLKENPKFGQVRQWRQWWETTIYNKYYDLLKELRSRGDIKQAPFAAYPKFVWKTPLYFVSTRLPELQGLF